MYSRLELYSCRYFLCLYIAGKYLYLAVYSKPHYHFRAFRGSTASLQNVYIIPITHPTVVGHKGSRSS